MMHGPTNIKYSDSSAQNFDISYRTGTLKN